MRIAILSTFPPRRCGIATFTTDLRGALLEADGVVEVLVAAITGEEPQEAGPEVLLQLRQHVRADYAEAAAALNRSGVDAVLIQHEFGIFGGDCGEYLLDLTAALEVPYVVTLHTVLVEPSPQQTRVLRALCEGAAQVTVFTVTGRDLLVRAGLAPWSGITVLNHGAPVELHRPAAAVDGRGLRPTCGEDSLRELEPHADRTILSTFGLLSSGKGIEVAVRSLAAVVEDHPEALYVVAGRTHPEVARREGESYRRSLEQLVAELGLEEHVLFVDRFLADDEIRALLSRTEVFLTPYRSHEQVVSGVLTFALVAGCAVVSTPYLYAADILSSGAGVLVPFDDHAAMAEGVRQLLADPVRRAAAAREALAIGAQHTWPEVGREALKVLSGAAEAREQSSGSVRLAASLARPSLRPELGPGVEPGREQELERSQLARLTDSVGIVQFAHGLEPDSSTGYCVDDVARLAMVAEALLGRCPDHAWLEQALDSALTFLEEAWATDEGAMHNFRAVDGAWLDRPHSGDHLGRAVWALGEVGAGSTAFSRRGLRLLSEVAACRPTLTAPRSMAVALLGLTRLPGAHLGASGQRWLEELADGLMSLYAENRSDGWRWFEDTLAYDNARLPQALLAAAARRHDPSQLAVGLEALEWYSHQCALDSDAVVLVGNRWRHRSAVEAASSEFGRGGRPAPGGGSGRGFADEGDEQPLDAAALVEACVEAYRITGSATYRRRAVDAFGWFHGRNRWGLTVYDEDTGGCHDGLGHGRLNANEGAESTLAYWQARIALESVGLEAGATAS